MIQGSVELCSIYVDLNFGVTSIGTQCIIYFVYSEYMFTTYHQHICLLLLMLLLCCYGTHHAE